jgi:hypothetical protein
MYGLKPVPFTLKPVPFELTHYPDLASLANLMARW